MIRYSMLLSNISATATTLSIVGAFLFQRAIVLCPSPASISNLFKLIFFIAAFSFILSTIPIAQIPSFSP